MLSVAVAVVVIATDLLWKLLWQYMCLVYCDLASQYAYMVINADVILFLVTALSIVLFVYLSDHQLVMRWYILWLKPSYYF